MGWLESERERLQGQWHGHHGNNGPRSCSEVGLSRTRCSTEALVAGAQFFGDTTPIPLRTIMVSSCTIPCQICGTRRACRQRWPCTKQRGLRKVTKIREMEGGFTECLPPKMKSFVIRRQAMLTPDQAKHLHLFTPTKGTRSGQDG